MKKTFITIALLAVIATLAVSCQKENIIEETYIVAENDAVYKVNYTIDGVTHHITLFGEKAWMEFLQYMLALAEEGHNVSFFNEENCSQVSSSKDVVVYTTTDATDAIKWADKMVNEGYFVTIDYDPRTGKYICTATN